MNVQPNVRNTHFLAPPRYIPLSPTFQRCIPWAIWSTPPIRTQPPPPPPPMRHPRPPPPAPPPPASLRLTPLMAHRQVRTRREITRLRRACPAGLTVRGPTGYCLARTKSTSNGTSTHYDLGRVGSVGQVRAHEVRGAGAPGSVWPTGYVRRYPGDTGSVRARRRGRVSRAGPSDPCRTARAGARRYGNERVRRRADEPVRAELGMSRRPVERAPP
jgi:hypothetical protein